MSKPLLTLMKELDDLIAIQSQALDQLNRLPSREHLSEVHDCEERIDALMAEIFSIRRYAVRSS